MVEHLDNVYRALGMTITTAKNKRKKRREGGREGRRREGKKGRKEKEKSTETADKNSQKVLSRKKKWYKINVSRSSNTA